jgi:hypothetical protein
MYYFQIGNIKIQSQSNIYYLVRNTILHTTLKSPRLLPANDSNQRHAERHLLAML